MLFLSLGKLDLITVLVLMGAAILPQKLLLMAAIYLIIKGLTFAFLANDFASKIDFVCGIYLVILAVAFKIPYVHTIVLLWLLQKTILTFVAIGLKLFIFYHEYKERVPSFK